MLPGAVGDQREALVTALREELAVAGPAGAWTVLPEGDVVGDVVGDPGEDEPGPDAVVRLVDAVVLRELGAEAAAHPALVRTAAQWREVMRAGPFAPGAAGVRQVLFLRDAPEPRLRRALVGRDWGGDQVVVRGREVYLRYAGTVEGSLAQHGTVLRYLDGVGTARDWDTVRAIGEALAGALARP
nr:hypothetical protein GCM10025730_48970 [Promicromonospora thailandica]